MSAFARYGDVALGVESAQPAARQDLEPPGPLLRFCHRLIRALRRWA